MGSVFIAPSCYLCYEVQRQRLVVWNLPCTLAGFVPFQLVCKMLHCLVAGIYTDMVFKCGKMYDIFLFPVCRHPPRYSFLRIGKSGTNSVAHLVQQCLYILRLKRDILVYCLWLLTEMLLVPVLEFAAALWALPHFIHSPLCSMITTGYINQNRMIWETLSLYPLRRRFHYYYSYPQK